MQVAILSACYNRKELTKRCLDSLICQFASIMDKQFDIYVYDDASTDGTLEMIEEEFPNVQVARGAGETYWCKSMHYLMKLAVEKNYDFYIMINDDVCFYNNAIEEMFRAYYMSKKKCGIVGAFQSAVSKEYTYGGRDRQTKLLKPNGQIQQCFWADWNCFMVDADVIKSIGIIDGKYQHAWGDWDYSYRMIKSGISIYETGDYIGECEINSIKNTYRDNTLSRRTRLKKLFSPKGLPLASCMRFYIKTRGIKGFFIVVYGYCVLLWYILIGRTID